MPSSCGSVGAGAGKNRRDRTHQDRDVQADVAAARVGRIERNPAPVRRVVAAADLPQAGAGSVTISAAAPHLTLAHIDDKDAREVFGGGA